MNQAMLVVSTFESTKNKKSWSRNKSEAVYSNSFSSSGVPYRLESRSRGRNKIWGLQGLTGVQGVITSGCAKGVGY